MNEMRYLGIDYGRKRVGIALSDDGGTIAFPQKPIVNEKRSMERTVKAVSSLIKRENIKKVIVGLPLSASGGETAMSSEIRHFGNALAYASSVKVIYENEILSTKIAEREDIPKPRVDGAAAAIILQSFLNKL